MKNSRITLTKLEFIGANVPTVSVDFAPGLNLILGPSDTGKTCVFEAIDFMLGAKRPLRTVPESEPYTDVALHLSLHDRPVTFKRTFAGGDITVVEFDQARDRPQTDLRILSTRHSDDPNVSFSAYLLDALGISGAKVRKNQRGDLKAFSFRDLCHLTLIDEIRILTLASPALSGQYVSKTAEQNAFAFVLSGKDDRSIVPPPSDTRTTRRTAEDAVFTALLEEKRAEFAALDVDPRSLADQIADLERELDTATRVVANTQAQIDEIERLRADLAHEHRLVRSRLLFISEQIKRLCLLESFYETDVARLHTVREASRVFHELPEGTCPLCSQNYPPHLSENAMHQEFEAACRQEIEKIVSLRTDLNEALADLKGEERELQNKASALGTDLSKVDSKLQGVLGPQSRTTQEQVQHLLGQRTKLAHAATLLSSMRGLEQRLSQLSEVENERESSPRFERRAYGTLLDELCHEITNVLRAWRYPNLERVGFDLDSFDIVVNGQKRANKGKGYRALLYSAFTVGLRTFCRNKGLPHPGLIALDTPLNPLKEVKEAKAGTLDETLPEDVKAAFFEHLAGSLGEDQVIVLENRDPSPHICARVKCHRFTKDPQAGRAGLFGPALEPSAPAPGPSAPRPVTRRRKGI